MTTDDTLLVPGPERPSVLVRPVLGCVALGAGISAVVLAWLIATHDFDAGPSAWAILVLPIAIFVALGTLQSLWWRYRLGGIRYEANAATLRVMRGETTIHEWRWRDVHKLRLDGGVDWYALMVLKAGTDDFPRLVVYAGDGRTKAPGVLVWGRAKAQQCESQLVELHRAKSH